MSIASDEYQTPKKYIKAAIEVMGSIDLDPACSDVNYQRLKKYISNYYPIDGLDKVWYGNVWLNEPYSKPNLTYWTRKLIKEWGKPNYIPSETMLQAINLVPSYTSEQWYHYLLFNCAAICLPNHRIHHLIDGKYKTSPRFSSTFFYLGPNMEAFMDIFTKFGKVFKN